MTDFDRTSNSETANILSTSCDKLLVTAPLIPAKTSNCAQVSVIPSLHEHDRFAHWRVPMDMISHGWSTSLFQA